MFTICSFLFGYKVLDSRIRLYFFFILESIFRRILYSSVFRGKDWGVRL